MYMTKTIARYLGTNKQRSEPEDTITIVEDEPLVLYNECYLSIDEPLIVREDGAVSSLPMQEGEKPTIRAVISTATPDRANDIVMQEGFQFQNYMQNPVVLWGHDHWMPAIAQTLLLGIDGQGRTWADALFPTMDICPMSFSIYQKIVNRFIRTVSVGFRPITWAYDEDRDGYNFLTQELLEWSVCTIPMNPEALIQVQGWPYEEQRSYQQLLHWQADTHSVKPWEQRRHWHTLRTLQHERRMVVVPEAVEPAPMQAVVPANVSMHLAEPGRYWSKAKLEDFSSEPWADIADDEKRRIAGHYAYSKTGAVPDKFGDLHLLHHSSSDGRIVAEGVKEALRQLAQSTIPQEDWPAIQDHLGSHLQALGEVPPWESDTAGWEKYCTMVDVLRTERHAEALQVAQEAFTRLDQQFFGTSQVQANPRNAAPVDSREDFLVLTED